MTSFSSFETDGATGNTICEYLWLGLTPIAVIAANDNVVEPCDEDRIAELEALIAGKTTQISGKQAEITTLTASISDVQTQIAELQERIDSFDTRIAGREAKIVRLEGKIAEHQVRIAELEAELAATPPHKICKIARLVRKIARQHVRIANKQAKILQVQDRIIVLQTRQAAAQAEQGALAVGIADTQAQIATLNGEITALETEIATHQAEQDALQAQCDAAGGTSGSGAATLSYLHTDHLGKPQFATNDNGAVIWDAGGQVTPFGDGINLAAAFTQNLQFPGQYADKETGLSHNHHRTYDPALGRYLQSDPIGLAGGLNRYAYVGGNPLSFVDPLGLSGVGTFPRGAAFAEAMAMLAKQAKTPVSKGPGAAFLLGYAIGGVAAAGYLEWQNINAINAAANGNAGDCDDDKSTLSDILDDLTTTPLPPPDRCKIVKEQCILECQGSLGGAPWSQAMPFNRCVQQCLFENNCGGTNYR